MMSQREASDGELVVRAVLRLLAETPRWQPNDPALPRSLVDALRTVPLFASLRARFSIDLVNAERNTWSIAASTDPTAKTGEEYSTHHGLTGWAIRTGRKAHLHFHNGTPAPVDLVPLGEYV